MTDFFGTSRNRKVAIGEKISSLVEIISVHFIQHSNPTRLIPIELSPKTTSPTLLKECDSSLQVEVRTTHWGQQILSQNIETLISCQGQVFMKPLSPIENKRIWKSITASTLTAHQAKYTLMFTPQRFRKGIYSLQLLLLTNGIRSLPILFEVPTIQVW